MVNVVDKKQMYEHVITEKENASKEWNCIILIFLMCLMSILCLVKACFMCICLKTALWLFLVKTGW